MGMEFAMKELGLGPRGGQLDAPAHKADWRRAEHNAPPCPVTGLPGLHKHEGSEPEFKDSVTLGIKDEQPWHRMAAYMILAGRTNSEIAMAANVTPQTVSHLRAQRWFQQLLAVLANETGADITGLLASEAAASVEKLVFLRDNAESERVSLAAATSLLEHAHGKAVQKIVSHTSHTVVPPQEEMAQLQQELEVLRLRNTQN